MRGAKDVALDDLSFWNEVLPALVHLHRVLPDYEVLYGPRVWLRFSAAELTRISELALQRVPLSEHREQSLDERTTGPAHVNSARESADSEGTPGPATLDVGLPEITTDTASSELSRAANRVVESLQRFARHRSLSGAPQTEILIKGCGFVPDTSADVLWSGTLLEMKLTGKPISTRDIRQVLIYAGLLEIAGGPVPESIGVINPRWGMAVVADLTEILHLCGGISVSEYADELAGHLLRLDRSN